MYGHQSLAKLHTNPIPKYPELLYLPLERGKETVKFDFLLGDGNELTPGKVQRQPDSNQDMPGKLKTRNFPHLKQ